MMREKAIALSYPVGADAPFIVASGKGLLAQRIVELAEQYGVPIVSEPNTAEILSLAEIGQAIPEETYEVLAKVFAFIKQLDS